MPSQLLSASAHRPVPSPARLARGLIDWYARSARPLPWRTTRDPYAIWISEIMLQQTQVKTVIPYWQRWMKQLPDVRALARAPEARVLKLWEGLGYYRRARHLHRAARQILKQHGGLFPSDFPSVLALPGVGRYTAGAICSIAFDQAVPIVDGNVARVLSRVFGMAGPVRDPAVQRDLWNLAERLVTAAGGLQAGRAATPGKVSGRRCSDFNQALMELGALVCTPTSPRCDACPWRNSCQASRLGLQDQIPGPASRPRAIALQHVALIVNRGRRHWVRQRPATAVNAGLWEFPCSELKPRQNAEGLAHSLGLGRPRLRPWMTVHHSITRYRIRLTAYRVEGSAGQSLPKQAGRWATPRQLRELPFTGAHRKLADALLRQMDGARRGVSSRERHSTGASSR